MYAVKRKNRGIVWIWLSMGNHSWLLDQGTGIRFRTKITPVEDTDRLCVIGKILGQKME